jgi:stearoyl-CoA desaturase (delta-9 desaturase)
LATLTATRTIDWIGLIPYVALHLGCFAVILVGWSPVAVATAIALYLIRMFALTGFYHRYFSHRTFRTSRAFQFVAAVLGNACVQRGPLWWAAHHRHHHIPTRSRISIRPARPASSGATWGGS